nr:MAG TPA: hypothetical protein [Caudoviricetes sp.]
MQTLMNDQLAYIIERVLANAIEAAAAAKAAPHDAFKDGRALAYYEALDTIKNELEICDMDTGKLGLGENLEVLLSPR